MICQNPSCSYLSTVEPLCSVSAYIKTYISCIAFPSNSACFAFRQRLGALYRKSIKFRLLRLRSNPHTLRYRKTVKIMKCELLDICKNICYNPVGEVYFILYIIPLYQCFSIYSNSRPGQTRDGFNYSIMLIISSLLRSSPNCGFSSLCSVTTTS